MESVKTKCMVASNPTLALKSVIWREVASRLVEAGAAKAELAARRTEAMVYFILNGFN